MRRAWARTVGVMACATLVACAANGRYAGSPAPAPAPRTIEEAQRDIDARMQEISGGSAAEGAATAASVPAPTATTAGTGGAVSPTQPPTAGGEPQQLGGVCGVQCRAIASMRRSVALLCSLSGDGDPRCVDARAKLEDGERRVAACGCPGAQP